MSARETMAPSLSMPENLHQLALDIEDIQNRLMSTSSSASTTTINNEHQEQIIKRCARSRSMVQLPSTLESEVKVDGIIGYAVTDLDDDEYYHDSLERSSLWSTYYGVNEVPDVETAASSSSATFLPLRFDEGTDDDTESTIGLSLSERPETAMIHDYDGQGKDNVYLASACLRELLLVIGVEEDSDTPQLFDDNANGATITKPTSKSPCSVIPEVQDRRTIHDRPNNPPQHSFVKLSPERRTNSMPLPRSKSAYTSSQATMLRRKSSLKNISSALMSASSIPTPTPTSNTSTGIKRVVSFNKLQIREYNLELSDHPSCSCGPPIQLGWEFQDKAAMPVEEYEEMRLPRRNSNDLVLSYNVRRYLLLKRAGYSKQELKQVMEDVNRVKRERLVTDLFLPMMKLDETLEEIADQIKATFSTKKKQAMQHGIATR